MPEELNGQNLQEQESPQEELLRLKAENLELENKLLRAQLSSKSPDGMDMMRSLISGLGIKTDQTKIQSHGKTVAEMEDLRLRQSQGVPHNMVKANNDPSYMIREDEQHLVHVGLRIDDWVKGVNKAKIKIQTFYVNDFKRMSQTVPEPGQKTRPENAFGIYDYIKVYHMPDKDEKIVAKLEAKKINAMNEDELRAEFLEITGEEAPEDATIPQLVLIITNLQAKS